MAYFYIGQHKIGEESPAFVIAELGANHNGDPLLAKKMIEAAAEANVDAVKFQTYTSANLLADYDRVIEWGPPGKEKSEPVGAMFDRLALPLQAYTDLFNYANSLGLFAFSTPFSIEEACFLDSLNVPCFKIASSDITYLDLLKMVAKFKKPMLISTGKCTLAEIDIAVNAIIESGCESLSVLHCVAQYPAPLEETNLRVISLLSSIYPDHVIGYSDHCIGTVACLGAVALGAKIIEKHFTLDCCLEGPDHWFSADPKELNKLVKDIRSLEAALGKSKKGILPCEKKERTTSTRSLVLKTKVEAGTALTPDLLKIVRPGWGIHPQDKEKVLGLKVQYNLPAGTVLKWDHFR